MKIKPEMSRSKNTIKLLSEISKRLSGRQGYESENYIVKIDFSGVSMTPLVYTFPNRYNRQESSKLDIVSYVHRYKMNDIDLSDLVFGTYKYESNFNKKRRRWTRLS